MLLRPSLRPLSLLILPNHLHRPSQSRFTGHTRSQPLHERHARPSLRNGAVQLQLLLWNLRTKRELIALTHRTAHGGQDVRKRIDDRLHSLVHPTLPLRARRSTRRTRRFLIPEDAFGALVAQVVRAPKLYRRLRQRQAHRARQVITQLFQRRRHVFPKRRERAIDRHIVGANFSKSPRSCLDAVRNLSLSRLPSTRPPSTLHFVRMKPKMK